MSISIDIDMPFMQIAYYSYTEYIYGLPIDINMPFIQSSYYSYILYAYGIALYDDYVYLKKLYNVIYFLFSGKSYMFDGEKFIDFSSPQTSIYKSLSCSGDICVSTGGFLFDGSIDSSIYLYNISVETATFNKDGIAIFSGDGDITIYDENGTAMFKIKRSGVAPVFRGWKAVSLYPFKVKVIET